MTTIPRRHKTVRINCKNCGIEFDTLVARQSKGQGNFCSLKCYREYNKTHPPVYKYTSKENACIYFDEKRGCRMVYWYDAGTNKRHNSTYAKWWWELNRGEVPDGFVVVGENEYEYQLITRSSLSREYGRKLAGRQFSDDTKQKMSASAKGKIISDEQRIKMSNTMKQLWAEGRFDDVHLGEHNYHWRDGASKRKYPREFNDGLKEFIKDRDEYTCQVCGRNLFRSKLANVHHINGDKKSNNPENLILLCKSCHSRIHAGGTLSPVLQAFRDKLYS